MLIVAHHFAQLHWHRSVFDAGWCADKTNPCVADAPYRIYEMRALRMGEKRSLAGDAGWYVCTILHRLLPTDRPLDVIHVFRLMAGAVDELVEGDGFQHFALHGGDFAPGRFEDLAHH